jgi:copper homeostasis protein
VLLEVCVDTAPGIAAAVEGGADRIELCSALEVGGLTPSAGLMRAAAGCGLPVMALIRPRAGDFVFEADEIAVMEADIAQAAACGLAGVVLGATRPDGRLDAGVLARLVAVAGGMDLTLHRAFDLVPDVAEAVDLAAGLGFRRILTSGGAARAAEGLARLRATFDAAGDRIGVMPGAGIETGTLGALAGLPLREVHASCSEARAAAPLGFGAPRWTSVAKVRALKSALVDLEAASR